MASKPAKILTREMQALGHVDKHIAAHAQQQIVNVFVRLAEQHKLGVETLS
jgi:flagellar motor switch protein FliG